MWNNVSNIHKENEQILIGFVLYDISSCFFFLFIFFQVIYNGESFMLDLLYLTCNEDPFIQVVGNEIPCTVEDVDAIDPITFLNEESFLLLPKWNAKVGTKHFHFFLLPAWQKYLFLPPPPPPQYCLPLVFSYITLKVHCCLLWE